MPKHAFRYVFAAFHARMFIFGALKDGRGVMKHPGVGALTLAHSALSSSRVRGGKRNCGVINQCLTMPRFQCTRNSFGALGLAWAASRSSPVMSS
jgi:hypothetical protein